jgi:hypothetical protein
MLRNLWIDEFAPVSVLREYIPRQRPSAGCRRRHLPRGWQPAAARYTPQPCRSPLPTRFRAEFMVGSEVCLLSNDVRFGSLADICSAKGHVRFAPNSDRESGHSMADRRGQPTQVTQGRMRRYKTSSRPAKQREGRSLAPTTGISVVSLKRGQSGTKRSRPPMGKSRCYCVNRRALRQNKSSQCSNQRCGESAGGEIVVTGLSGFTGVPAVAGEGGAGCAGAACCGLTKVGSGRPCG